MNKERQSTTYVSGNFFVPRNGQSRQGNRVKPNTAAAMHKTGSIGKMSKSDHSGYSDNESQEENKAKKTTVNRRANSIPSNHGKSKDMSGPAEQYNDGYLGMSGKHSAHMQSCSIEENESVAYGGQASLMTSSQYMASTGFNHVEMKSTNSPRGQNRK